MSVRLLCSSYDLFHGDILAAVANVFRDGRSEQNWFLADDANVLTQPLDVVVPYVNAIDLNLVINNITVAYTSMSKIR